MDFFLLSREALLRLFNQGEYYLRSFVELFVLHKTVVGNYWEMCQNWSQGALLGRSPPGCSTALPGQPKERTAWFKEPMRKYGFCPYIILNIFAFRTQWLFVSALKAYELTIQAENEGEYCEGMKTE